MGFLLVVTKMKVTIKPAYKFRWLFLAAGICLLLVQKPALYPFLGGIAVFAIRELSPGAVIYIDDKIVSFSGKRVFLDNIDEIFLKKHFFSEVLFVQAKGRKFLLAHGLYYGNKNVRFLRDCLKQAVNGK